MACGAAGGCWGGAGPPSMGLLETCKHNLSCTMHSRHDPRKLVCKEALLGKNTPFSDRGNSGK